MASQEITEVTDRDYLPLPVDPRDVQLKALDIAWHIITCRQHKHWQAASMLEAKLGRMAREADGGSRLAIEGVQQTLAKDMARRLRDNPVKLRSITV